jgi:hypothetical protein
MYLIFLYGEEVLFLYGEEVLLGVNVIITHFYMLWHHKTTNDKNKKVGDVWIFVNHYQEVVQEHHEQEGKITQAS